MKKILLPIAIILVFLLLLLYLIPQNEKLKYTYEYLKSLPEEELYQTFIDNGLKVTSEMTHGQPREYMQDSLKHFFDLYIKGEAPILSIAKLDLFAKEVQRVYQLLLKTEIPSEAA